MAVRIQALQVSPNPSSCARCFEKPKLKTSEFGLRKGLWIKKAATEKMGDLVMPQNHLARWTKLRVFKGLEEQVCRSTAGASFNWRTWNLAIYGKGLLSLIHI